MGEKWTPGRSAEDVAAERVGAMNAVRCRIAPPFVLPEGTWGALYTRPHGEQPELQPVSSLGACPFCERVPCEDGVHALWRARKSGSDV